MRLACTVTRIEIETDSMERLDHYSARGRTRTVLYQTEQTITIEARIHDLTFQTGDFEEIREEIERRLNRNPIDPGPHDIEIEETRGVPGPTDILLEAPEERDE